MVRLLLLVFVAITTFSCSNDYSSKKLPYLGEPNVINGDTIYPQIPYFKLVNQNNQVVTNKTIKDKIYVASFIFLDCPTICPVMTKETHKVYEHFKKNKNIAFISHTIDPEHDTVEKLKAYAQRIGIDDTKWHFLTGKKSAIYDLAEQGYFSIAKEDSSAPGGYIHSGGLLLVDKNQHIRGVYDGTNKKETQRLIQDIELLVKE
jgi:protein SCO1/2